MKQTRAISLISCLVAALYFLVFSFSDSIAQPTDPDPLERLNKCISCCTDKKTACFNINPDRRLCETFFQECLTTCKSEGDIPSDWSDCWDYSE